MPRLAAPLLALLLALGLLAGGLRPAEWAQLVALLALAGLWSWSARAPGAPTPAGPSPRATRALDALLVGGATLAFAAGAASLPTRDTPLGTDWFAYLRNVVVLDGGDWDAWQTWRAPGHAVAVWLLVEPAGGLIEASQLVSLLALSATIPLTFALGRLLLGPWPARLGALLVAGWPEARLFARASTPYPLLAVLFLAGLTATVAALRAGPDDRRPKVWVPLAGLSLGLATVTDVRGAGLTAVVVVACLVAAPWMGARAAAVGLGVGGLAWGVHALAYAAFPVELVPLTEQIALQRDLNATEGARTCAVGAGAIPTLAELLGPCARETLAGNVGRAQDALPVSLGFLVPLVLAGLVPRAGQPRWATAPLLLPLLGALPTLLLVGFQHRYALPLAPLVALLAANTLTGLAPAGRGRAAGLALAVVVAAVLWGAWERWPGTPLARAWSGTSTTGVAPSVILGQDRGLTRVRALLREGLGADDRVVDCAHAGLRMRLFPRPVDEWSAGGRASPRCAGLLREGPGAADRPTWLVVAWLPPTEPGPGWEVVYAWQRGPETAALLRAGPR